MCCFTRCAKWRGWWGEGTRPNTPAVKEWSLFACWLWRLWWLWLLPDIFLDRFRRLCHLLGVPWLKSDNKLDIAREALRLAELHLQGQFSLMIAADQRASTFSGIIIAAVAVLASMRENGSANWNDDLGLLVLATSAILAAFSARSVKIYIPGNNFKNMASDIEKDRDILLVFLELGAIFDKASESNRKIISKNSKLFNSAILVAFFGFIVGMFPLFISLSKNLYCMFTSTGTGTP